MTFSDVEDHARRSEEQGWASQDDRNRVIVLTAVGSGPSKAELGCGI